MLADAPRPLQVLPLGIGNAFAKLEYYTSLVILAGKTACLVDCPDPIHKTLHEQTAKAGIPLDAGDLDHVVLTHLHGDHSSGLESFFYFRRFVLEAPPPTLYMLPEVAEAIWECRLAASMGRSVLAARGIDETYEARDFFVPQIVEEGQSVRAGDLEFKIHRSLHPLPTFGFRVSYGGRSFGYSCDTIFDPDYITFLAEADLIFHECSDSLLHTPYASLWNLAPAVRDKLHILHLADEFDRGASQLPIVEPGRLYTV